MLQVVEIVDLEIDMLGAGLRPSVQLFRDLVRRPAHDARCRVCGINADGGGASLHLGGVRAAADDDARREGEGCRVAANVLARLSDPPEQRRRRGDRYERRIELRRIARRQRRGPSRTFAAYDDRRPRVLDRFWSAGLPSTT